MGFGTHVYAATTRVVGIMYTLRTVDYAGGREVRTWQMFHDSIDIQFRIFTQGDRGIDNFIEIVRRDIGRHTHCDTCRTIDQQPRNAGREHQWLILGFIVVGTEIDRLLFEVGQ